jgi:hypothetical protein
MSPPLLALLLSLVSAGATAGFAGLYLRSAWSGVASCSSTGASGCAAHPFWGFPPELYLLACLLGVGAGALVAVVGGLAFRGILDPERAGYGIVALSAVGVISYGGLGVGVVAGVAAGTLFLRSKKSRSKAPSEWSGSLPPGVPAVPPGSKRKLASRPPVTEWSGIFATAPQAPPNLGKTRTPLPSADRLSAALQRSRVASTLPRSNGPLPPPAIVLPPPPTGLRSSVRPAPRPASAPPPAPARPASPPPAAPVAGLAPPGTSVTPQARPWPAPAERRGPLEASEFSPWAGAVQPPPQPAPPASRPAPGATPRSVSPTGAFAAAPAEVVLPPPQLVSARSSAPPVGGAPPPKPVPTPASARLAGPLRSPLRNAEAPPGQWSATPSPAPRPAAFPGPPAAAPPPAFATVIPPPSPPTAPALQAPATPPRLFDTAPQPPTASRPPPPSGPLGKPRVRAWTCSKCGLLNAPWSPRCTRCRTEAPPLGQ